MLAAVAIVGIIYFAEASLPGPKAQGASRVYCPIIMRAPAPTATPTPICQPIPGASYGTLRIEGAPSDRPAEAHADLNLALRGYVQATGQYVGILNNCSDPPGDWNAPQLRGLFADRRVPTFLSVHWVYRWDWACGCRGAGVEDAYGPSLAKVAATPGEVLYVPDSGYSIAEPQGYEVLVLYASSNRLTLKYTREDNVVRGYSLHLEDICVDGNLLALYEAMNAAGRWELPALRARQPFGRARSGEFGVVIRDVGNWMDIRSCKDWWRLP